jgi:hypothetical protein
MWLNRLLTVIDCDQILVMAKGKLVEMGHPYDLLCRHLGDNPLTAISLHHAPAPDLATNGTGNKSTVPTDKVPPRDSFASMVLETGQEMAMQLCRLAYLHKQSYK